MNASLETNKSPIATPQLKALFSPSPIKKNADCNNTDSLQEERNLDDEHQQLHVLTLAQALEHAQKHGLPKQRRILLPSSKRKNSLRTKVARENTPVTTEEAIQATMERIGTRHHRILNLIASRDPMDTIMTAEEFWNTESHIHHVDSEHSRDTSCNDTTSSTPVHSATSRIQKAVQNEETDYPWITQVDIDTSTTTPCTVQVDFDIPHASENDDFSYEISPNHDDDLYLQQDIHDQHKHAYKIQHVGGMTVDSHSKGNVSHPSKRPKEVNPAGKSTQNWLTRKTENRRGQPRELRFLPTSREGDGLRQVGSGIRRSQRTRFPVLKFWKNETILYERRDSRQFPTIAGILAYPDTPQEEERKSRRRRRRGNHSSRTVSSGTVEYSSGTETSDS
ncbi:hypothetical protein GpartN1_g5171.t1 [Galdieria partita]|uniref:Uncharacterized protein n=1 Tax=Galdieria partita TaxID=83374 RepID=A0A9C7PZM2_9RHOD|nr:hypothetical protein GpartN1_g5171.t1 [Galdieria partita]